MNKDMLFEVEGLKDLDDDYWFEELMKAEPSDDQTVKLAIGKTMNLTPKGISYE